MPILFHAHALSFLQGGLPAWLLKQDGIKVRTIDASK